MTYSISLIDKAGEKCGSFYALAKRIDLAQSTISEIRAGKRRLPADVVPILAEVIGMDVDEAIHGVLMEHAKGTKREKVLEGILGKALAGGAAAMLVISYNVGWNSSMDPVTTMAQKSNESIHCCINKEGAEFESRSLMPLANGNLGGPTHFDAFTAALQPHGSNSATG